MNTPDHYETDLVFYFGDHTRELTLYQALFDRMDTVMPEASVKVQKSQISFYCPRLFAALSLPIRQKNDWPRHCLLVTFGLGHQMEHPRIAVAVEPYPNRWTHHVVLSSVDEIDGQLLDWLQAAYTFSREK